MRGGNCPFPSLQDWALAHPLCLLLQKIIITSAIESHWCWRCHWRSGATDESMPKSNSASELSIRTFCKKNELSPSLTVIVFHKCQLLPLIIQGQVISSPMLSLSKVPVKWPIFALPETSICQGDSPVGRVPCFRLPWSSGWRWGPRAVKFGNVYWWEVLKPLNLQRH